MTFQLNAQPPLLDQSNRNPQADRHPILEQKLMHNMLNMIIDIKYAKYVLSLENDMCCQKYVKYAIHMNMFFLIWKLQFLLLVK